MKKPKVLLIQEILQRYRAPIYKLMSKEVDLDLAYTEKNDINDPELNVFQLQHFKLWKFNIHTGIYKIFNKSSYSFHTYFFLLIVLLFLVS